MDLRTYDELSFYHAHLLLFYPSLWTLVGVLAILVPPDGQPKSWPSIADFGSRFVVMSLAALRTTRHFGFVFPFVAFAGSIELSQLVRPSRSRSNRMHTQLLKALALPQHHNIEIAALVVHTTLTVVILEDPDWLPSAAVISNVAMRGEESVTDWQPAHDALAPLASGTVMMITMEELGGMRLVWRLSPYRPYKAQVVLRHQVNISHQTNRPTITDSVSIERLIERFPNDFVVESIESLGNTTRINDETQVILMCYAISAGVPTRSRLCAWSCNRESPTIQPVHCSELLRFSGRHDIA